MLQAVAATVLVLPIEHSTLFPPAQVCPATKSVGVLKEVLTEQEVTLPEPLAVLLPDALKVAVQFGAAKVV